MIIRWKCATFIPFVMYANVILLFVSVLRFCPPTPRWPYCQSPYDCNLKSAPAAERQWRKHTTHQWTLTVTESISLMNSCSEYRIELPHYLRHPQFLKSICVISSSFAFSKLYPYEKCSHQAFPSSTISPIRIHPILWLDSSHFPLHLLLVDRPTIAFSILRRSEERTFLVAGWFASLKSLAPFTFLISLRKMLFGQ